MVLLGAGSKAATQLGFCGLWKTPNQKLSVLSKTRFIVCVTPGPILTLGDLMGSCGVNLMYIRWLLNGQTH